MSVYTMELRTVCEAVTHQTDREEYPNVNTLIEQARPLIFDFDYPIFDAKYKSILERKIIKYFYFREICDVPLSKWKIFLDVKLNNIMPYYNQLYLSTNLKFNPMYTDSYSRKFKRTNDSSANVDATSNINGNTTVDSSQNTTNNEESKIKDSGSVNETNTATSKTTIDTSNELTTNEKLRQSDTPQGTLTPLENNTYLTNAQINDRTSSDTGTSTTDGNTTQNNGQVSANERSITSNITNDLVITNKTELSNNQIDNTTSNINSLEDYSEMLFGYRGKSGSELLNEYRSTFLNIDAQVLEELNSLFFLIY